MGGELDIRAHFPEGDVRINQFEEVDDKQQTAAWERQGCYPWQ